VSQEVTIAANYLLTNWDDPLRKEIIRSISVPYHPSMGRTVYLPYMNGFDFYGFHVITVRIVGSQNWWFGDPRPLRKTHPNPSKKQGYP